MNNKLITGLDILCQKLRNDILSIRKQRPTSINRKDRLKKKPGVYIFGSLDSPVYIGATKNIKKRINQLYSTLINCDTGTIPKKSQNISLRENS